MDKFITFFNKERKTSELFDLFIILLAIVMIPIAFVFMFS